MTARSYVTIWCDGGDCSRFNATEYHTATEARSNSALMGWIRRGRLDLCPWCKIKPGRAASDGETDNG